MSSTTQTPRTNAESYPVVSPFPPEIEAELASLAREAWADDRVVCGESWVEINGIRFDHPQLAFDFDARTRAKASFPILIKPRKVVPHGYCGKPLPHALPTSPEAPQNASVSNVPLDLYVPYKAALVEDIPATVEVWRPVFQAEKYGSTVKLKPVEISESTGEIREIKAKRGEYSKEAATRFSKFFGGLHDNVFYAHATLTYKNPPRDTATFERHRDNLIDRFRRRGQLFVWRVQFQNNGAIHSHWLLARKTEDSPHLTESDILVMWEEITGESHRAAVKVTEEFTPWYLSKREQHLSDWFTGRHYAYSRELAKEPQWQRPADLTVLLTPEEVEELRQDVSEDRGRYLRRGLHTFYNAAHHLPVPG